MARTCRIKMTGSGAYYHIMSRTVGQDFLLKDNEKDKFVEMLFELPRLFLVKIIGFAIMSNHFHILIKMEKGDSCDDQEIKKRLENYYRRNLSLTENEIDAYKQKLCDISYCIKHLKQRFSLWYNQLNRRKGYFWSDRFKSVLIESGESLLNCLAYIDLNPVRADIVKVPEKYEWNSIHYRANRKPHSDSLSLDGIEGSQDESYLKSYMNFLYYTGNINDQDFDTKSVVLCKGVFRTKYNIFSDCLVMGSKNFIYDSYQIFGDSVLAKRNKAAYVSEFSNKVFSVRRKYQKPMH